MKKTAGAAVTVSTELGLINDNMSMTPDSLQADIPQGDYMITQDLEVAAGDRVLVAWCGDEPVVVAVVVSS